MKQYLTHFNIYRDFVELQGKVLVLPEFSQPITDIAFFNRIRNKISNINWDEDIDYREGLVLNDMSLLDDLKDEALFLLFFTYPDKKEHLNNEWDSRFSLDSLIFLGWTIESNRGDSVIYDGVFPIMLERDLEPMIDSLHHLNKYGLLDDEMLNIYLERNKKEVVTFLQGVEIDVTWSPVGVFCDPSTFFKLESFF